MANKPGMSTTATATLMVKPCANSACGRMFETYEYSRDYCTLKCKDYAARRRRRLAENMKNDGHDPRLGATNKEVQEVHRVAAEQIKADITISDDAAIRFLYDAVVNRGLSHLMNDQTIAVNVRQAVSKMLIEREKNNGSDVAAPTSSYIVQDDGSESVLKDLGLLKGDQATEYVPDVPLTDEDKARDL